MRKTFPLVGAGAALLLLTGCTTGAAAPAPSTSPVASAQVPQVAPGLQRYSTEDLQRLWDRPGLSDRDRSLVTVAQIIASGQSEQLRPYLERALEDGVRPAEISETITQLAFYAGWNTALEAVPVTAAVFEARGVDGTDLPAADPTLLPLDQDAEQARDDQVSSDFGSTAPGVVEATRDVLFRDLWLRPGLAPRDRSLVTVVSLVTNGQSAQVSYHLGRAMDNGLTRQQAGESLTQLAYFAGWPDVFSALPVFKEVFESR